MPVTLAELRDQRFGVAVTLLHQRAYRRTRVDGADHGDDVAAAQLQEHDRDRVVADWDIVEGLVEDALQAMLGLAICATALTVPISSQVRTAIFTNAGRGHGFRASSRS